jgi:gamma-glutamylcyclotransferase (GGCT)/AIG2-like uncharacterized protein YtfP
MRMFLNGTAMSGQPDHHRLQQARFLGAVTTAPRYRFYAVRDEFPGLVPVTESGRSIRGELYDIDTETWQNSLGPSEPSELDLGQIELADGISVYAMILDPSTLPPDEITDITELGSWRRHLEVTGLDAPRARTS